VSFTKMSVIFVFVQVTIFTAIILAFSWFEKAVPGELIVSFFAWFGLEGGALALLKIDSRKQKNSTEVAALKKENTALKKKLAEVKKAVGGEQLKIDA